MDENEMERETEQEAAHVRADGSMGRVSPRMRAWAALVAEGVSPVEAARQVGYKSPARSAEMNLEHPGLRSQFRDALEAAGITVDTLAGKLAQALDATQTVRVEAVNETAAAEAKAAGRRVQRQYVHVEVPDSKAQLTALEIAMRALGLFPDMRVQVDARVVNERCETVVLADPEAAGLKGSELLAHLQQRVAKKQDRAESAAAAAIR